MHTLVGFLYGLLVLGGAVLSGLVIGTLGVLPFAVLPRGRRERYAMPAAQVWAWSVLGLLRVRLVVDGEWSLPSARGALILCNHRSWLDPVVLMAATRSNGLSKAQIFWLPAIGFYGWLAGAVFFNRRKRSERERARHEVVDLIRCGHRVQVFPEGSRQVAPGTKERVHLRLAMDCYREGLALVPCVIHGSEVALPPGRLGAFGGTQVRLSILSPMNPRDFDSARDFATAAWQRVRDEYARMDAGASTA